MKRIFIAAICAIFFPLISCNNEPPVEFIFPPEASKDSDSRELKKVAEYTIKLDSTIGITNQSISYFEESNRSMLSILNSFDNSVHIYEYPSGVLVKKLKLEIEGENGVGKTSNMGHFINSSDSIFLLNHWENRVYLLDSDAKVLKKYDIPIDNLPFEFYIMTNPASPVFKVGKRLFITVQTSGTNNKVSKSVIELDLLTSQTQWHVSGSPFMDKAFWGILTPYALSGAMNMEDSIIVTSVAKDPYVRAYKLSNLSNPIVEKVTTSDYIDRFMSFQKKNNTPPLYGHDYKEIASETNRQALFSSIDYDSFNKLYYRQLILPRTQDEYELRAKGIEQSIIILDKDLSKVGETKLPKGKYLLNFYFINDEGIHLANLDKYSSNEDELVFDIYKPIINNETQ